MEKLAKAPEGMFRDQWPGWSEFLGACKERRRSVKEWVPVSEKLAADNGGSLPCKKWLRENKLQGLMIAMRDRPELFSHVPQSSPYKKPEEWVLVASRLASDRGGVLPCAEWLRKNNYAGLYNSMYNYPGLFAHIPQERRDSKGRVIQD